ncbi:hypothetical protein [Candidatus Halobonum tyrrellensis]|uniref:HPr kinase n=1 Tax=Candidatus Halobonum tyrrellensis G22 TaxID=1324957 RepID=V4HJR3_9EURY|nr:hypothetical protein [Candidatus Halobonum tyrrellensis]ESP90003.1 hypothetical protein K933_00532 [Candidatus Halobonum tyrrellensis G22]
MVYEMNGSGPYYYSAYDLTIRSTFDLPELPSVERDESDIDVEFVHGAVEPVPESVEGVGGRRIEATAGACRLTYESVGSFLVEGGRRIVCDPLSGDVPERDVFRRLLENEMLGLILYQRDHLVLHASAVSVDGRAAVFLGPRGAGKSTTAAAFQTNGYPMLEDDVVGIRFDDDGPTVVPGVPQLRLKPDAAAALGVTEASTPAPDSWYEKRYLQVDEVPDPAPLAWCYLLRDGDQVGLEEVSGSDRLLELISRTHARGLLSDTEQSPDHFEQCSRVAQMIRFGELKRPRDHAVLGSIVDTVSESMRS